jgi:hypothetical protein
MWQHYAQLLGGGGVIAPICGEEDGAVEAGTIVCK